MSAGAGGLAAAERRVAPLLAQMNTVLCGPSPRPCGLDAPPTRLDAAGPVPRLKGPLAQGATAAQILLLEYAGGKPAAEVGRARADARAVASLSRLHALEFALLARPVPFARARLAALAPMMATALAESSGPPILVIVGHDTNVASLGGLLGLHWKVPGAADDDPLPGGAVILERIVDERRRRYVRAVYRSQTVEQIRALTPLMARTRPLEAVLPIAARPDRSALPLCPLDATARLLDGGPSPTAD